MPAAAAGTSGACRAAPADQGYAEALYHNSRSRLTARHTRRGSGGIVKTLLVRALTLDRVPQKASWQIPQTGFGRILLAQLCLNRRAPTPFSLSLGFRDASGRQRHNWGWLLSTPLNQPVYKHVDEHFGNGRQLPGTESGADSSRDHGGTDPGRFAAIWYWRLQRQVIGDASVRSANS